MAGVVADPVVVGCLRSHHQNCCKSNSKCHKKQVPMCLGSSMISIQVVCPQADSVVIWHIIIGLHAWIVAVTTLLLLAVVISFCRLAIYASQLALYCTAVPAVIHMRCLLGNWFRTVDSSAEVLWSASWCRPAPPPSSTAVSNRAVFSNGIHQDSSSYQLPSATGHNLPTPAGNGNMSTVCMAVPTTLATSSAASQSGRQTLPQLVLAVHKEVSRRATARCGKLPFATPSYKSPVQKQVLSIKVHDHRAYHHRVSIAAALEASLRLSHSIQPHSSDTAPLVSVYAMPGCLQLLVHIAEPLQPTTGETLTQVQSLHNPPTDSGQVPPCPQHQVCSAMTAAYLQGLDHALPFARLIAALREAQLSPSMLVSTGNGAIIRCAAPASQPPPHVQHGGQGTMHEGMLALDDKRPQAALQLPIHPHVLGSSAADRMELVVDLEALGGEEREVELLVLYRLEGEQRRQRHQVNLPQKGIRLSLDPYLEAGPVEIVVLDARHGLEGVLLATTIAFALPPSAAEELRALFQHEECSELQHALLSDLAVVWQLPRTFSSAASHQSRKLLSSVLNFFLDHDLPRCYSCLMQRCMHTAHSPLWKHTQLTPHAPPISQPPHTSVITRLSSAAHSAASLAASVVRWLMQLVTPAGCHSMQPRAGAKAVLHPSQPIPCRHSEGAAPANTPLDSKVPSFQGGSERAARLRRVLPGADGSSAARPSHDHLCNSVPADVKAHAAGSTNSSSTNSTTADMHPPTCFTDALRVGYRHWCSHYARGSDICALTGLVAVILGVSVKIAAFFPPEVMAQVAPATIRKMHWSAVAVNTTVALPPVLLVLGGRRAQAARPAIVLAFSLIFALIHILASRCQGFLLLRAVTAAMVSRRLPLVVYAGVARPALLHVHWPVQLLASLIEAMGMLLNMAQPGCADDPSALLPGSSSASLHQAITQQLAIVVAAAVTSLTVDWVMFLRHQAEVSRLRDTLRHNKATLLPPQGSGLKPSAHQ